MKNTIWIVLGLAVLVLTAFADAPPKPDYPPWSKVGKDLTPLEGYWNIYRDKKKTKFWVEIRELGKPFLMATSISGGTTLRGHQWNDWLLAWEVQGKKLVLMERNVGIRVKTGTPELKQAIADTYRSRVVATYPILAKGPKGGYVIDGQRFFASGASTFFGGLGRSKDASLAKFDGTKNFAGNTEVRVTMPRAGSGTLITLHYSLSRLAKTNYKPRVADDRIGYFLTVLKDFSESNKDEQRNVRYINRWQLEKAKPKLPVCEPKMPIIFYIEKTVPVPLRRAVREGILEWNKAFEKIGFYNTIVVEQQTETRFADFDPEDIRYNFFRWIYSDSPFAMGPSRVDPRTGQILDADILFDDSYVRFTLQEYRLTIKEIPSSAIGARGRELLAVHPLRRLGIVPARDEFAYAIPADAARPEVAPFARRAFCSIGRGMRHQLALSSLVFAGAQPGGTTPPKAGDPIPKKLLFQFVKDTVMHEVGHTLGLRHNFAGSIYRTLDEINSKEKPAQIGGSVMDYQPLDIAPEGDPQGNWSMTTIGPYDYWAIEYGYTTKKADLPKITARVAEKGLAYATDEDTWSSDPYVNRWDLGADPLNYARERIALMKRLRANLEARAVDKGERYHRLRQAMDMQFYEADSAAYLAARFVGGEHIHRDHRGDPNARPPLQPVAAAKQREALAFVCDEILSGRYFKFDPDLLRKLAPDYWGEDYLRFFFEGHEYPFLDNVLGVQMSVVFTLTAPSRLGRVLDARHETAPGEEVLTAPEIFDALERTIFHGLDAITEGTFTNQNPALGDMQRNLQREYTSHLIFILLQGDGWYPAAVQTLARHYVKELAQRIKTTLDKAAGLDTYTRAHLEECHARLSRALEASYRIPD